MQASTSTNTVIRWLATVLLSLLLGSPALALKNNYCEAEMAARAAEKLTPEQADQLDRYQGFNMSMQERGEIMRELVRAHLAGEQERNPVIGVWKPDGSAVATCLIKAVADGNKEKEIAPYALEAYGLMLLSGQGVKRDRAQGMAYLARAAAWNYGSASMHLANIYLADKGNPESRGKAIEWLYRATIFSEIPNHSANPAPAAGMLFDIYLPKSGRQDFKAAEALYRRLAGERFHQDLLKTVLPRIPGLAEELEAERQAYEFQRKHNAYMQCLREQRAGIRRSCI